MYARKRLDLGPAVLARGLACCLWPPSRAAAEARIAAAWEPAEAVLACTSVRSAFDLLLSCAGFSPGAEVLMSAVTIPHMARLVELHGFRPVAIDLDPATMAVAPADVERALTSRSVALVVAHLFGGRSDTAELAALCRARGLLLIEDCAQCYDGRRRQGEADVELYSFGTIKTATCLGGAVALVSDRTLRTAMRERQAQQPAAGHLAFALKLVKYALLASLSGPRAYAVFIRLLDALSGDFDRVLRSLTRGFPEDELLPRIRQRPSRALLGLLAHRLHAPCDLAGRRAAGERMRGRLRGIQVLGAEAAAHVHWLFPVACADPPGLVARLRRAGFDATQGASTLVAIDADAERASQALRAIVYLPVYPELPVEQLDELARLVEDHESGRR
jgi:dTDP-4-amino-4,6-dideoxygalactose transaminase